MLLAFRNKSVYASGQRIFFFSQIFMLIACAIMFSNLGGQRTKTNIKNAALTVALVSLFVNALSWIFLETPVIG